MHRAALCRVESYRVVSCRIVSHCTTPHHTTPHHLSPPPPTKTNPGRPPRHGKVHAADDRDKDDVVKGVRGAELEAEDVVEVHRDDQRAGPVTARVDAEKARAARAVLDGESVGSVVEEVDKVGEGKDRDHRVAQRVEQEPTSPGRVTKQRLAHEEVDELEEGEADAEGLGWGLGVGWGGVEDGG